MTVFMDSVPILNVEILRISEKWIWLDDRNGRLLMEAMGDRYSDILIDVMYDDGQIFRNCTFDFSGPMTGSHGVVHGIRFNN